MLTLLSSSISHLTFCAFCAFCVTNQIRAPLEISAISFISVGQNIKAIYDFCEISIPYFPNISLFADKMMNSLSVIVMMWLMLYPRHKENIVST